MDQWGLVNLSDGEWSNSSVAWGVMSSRVPGNTVANPGLVEWGDLIMVSPIKLTGLVGGYSIPSTLLLRCSVCQVIDTLKPTEIKYILDLFISMSNIPNIYQVDGVATKLTIYWQWFGLVEALNSIRFLHSWLKVTKLLIFKSEDCHLIFTRFQNELDKSSTSSPWVL